jgi:DNA repair protein RadD
MLSLKPSITPRYYQTESINACYRSFKESPDNRPIIVLPTGAGKALVTTLLTIDAINWKRRILHLTHTKELVSQNAQTAIDCIDGHIDVGICSAGLGKFDLVHDCLFAGIQTFVNRVGDCPAVDLLVIDECHRISVDDDTAYKKVIDTLLLKNPKLRILGLSATPFRLGQGMLTWHVVKKGLDVPIEGEVLVAELIHAETEDVCSACGDQLMPLARITQTQHSRGHCGQIIGPAGDGP